MSGAATHPAVLEEHQLLRQRLRQAGILLVPCDGEGELRLRPPRGSDWLADLCCLSPLFRRHVQRAAAHWNQQEQPEILPVFPGLVLAPNPVAARRGRSGYTIAVLFTPEALEAEQLAAMCQGAQLDLNLVRSLLAALPPVASTDVSRVAALVAHAHEDQRRLRGETAAMESVGSQLAESYEEISLLYTVIANMGVVQQPDRFIAVTCQQLLETLSYRWVAALFHDSHQFVKSLSGWFRLVGEVGRPAAEVQALLRSLFPRLRARSPLVIEPQSNPADAGFRGLGQVLLAHPVTRDGQVLGVLVAGEKHGEDVEATSGDLKLLGATASHMAIFLENAALYDDLNGMFLGTLEALTSAIDAKDRYTCGHSERVALLTRQLAEAIHLDEATCGRYHIAGLVHDVGKIGVPERVLTKPGRLTEDEFARIREHPEIGYRILKDIPQLADVLPGVLHHHERWDGKGYPHAIAGENIPRIARLIALGDAFDAMSSTRTYRAALSRTETLREIERHTGRQFDPELVSVFTSLDFSAFDRLVEVHRAMDVPAARPRGEAA